MKLASCFGHKRAGDWISAQISVFDKIQKDFCNDNRPVVWFHCASLGEFEQARPVIERLRWSEPEKKIVITFFSPSGYNVRKDYELADHVFYLPVDTNKNARKFISIVQPETAIFVKYEFWFNFLNELSRHKIRTLFISAVFRENQYFFSWYGKYFRNVLRNADHIFLQDHESAELLTKYQFNNFSISGDTRYDRVVAITKDVVPVDKVKQFKGGTLLLVAGSSWQEDEAVLREYFNCDEISIKLLIAPHDIGEPHLQQIEQMFDNKTVRYSEYAGGNADKIMILDNIGLLSFIYQYADIAFVGGGFKQGLHNILEPAAFGIPVLFGNKFCHKYPEATALIKVGGGFGIKNSLDFNNVINNLLSEKTILKNTGQLSREFVLAQTGATAKIITHFI